MRAAALLLAAAVLAGCGGQGEGGAAGEPIDVFAAASLRDVLPELDGTPRYVFGGSDELAAQIRDGAPADLFLGASERVAAELHEAGAVEEPVVFASNRLVVAVPAANPARIEALEDLARRDVKLVVAGEGVPVGDYARELFAAAGLEAALDNVVSEEQDVKGVLGKVALGEADAGVVYTTDVAAAGHDVRSVAVPERLQPDIAYVAAVVSAGDTVRAEAYLERLLGADGAAALRDAGFRAVPR